MQTQEIPKLFLDKVTKILPEKELEDFKRALVEPPLKAFRVNSLRATPKEVKGSLEKKGFKLTQMPWYKYGFFVNSFGASLGNTLEHFLGKIYVQDASSMLPIIPLDAEEDDSILDLAAAPGSKTTQIGMDMKNQGLIVANEPNQKRIQALQDNLERLGIINVVITRNDGRYFRKMPNSFDKVLLDAPCSLEGTMFKDEKIKHKWGPSFVNSSAKLEYELLKAAITTTKPNGTIIYSTCTISPEENELVINRALNEFDLKIEKVNFEGLDTSPGITEYNEQELNKDVKRCVRIWPHKSKTGAFFLTKLVKK
jgi:NOL1/NOP2/sun family putative RNA methylase